jgi:hypothetical protein
MLFFDILMTVGESADYADDADFLKAILREYVSSADNNSVFPVSLWLTLWLAIAHHGGIRRGWRTVISPDFALFQTPSPPPPGGGCGRDAATFCKALQTFATLCKGFLEKKDCLFFGWLGGLGALVVKKPALCLCYFVVNIPINDPLSTINFL